MFIHSQKRNPETHLKDPNMVWDFFANHPMATHQVRYFVSKNLYIHFVLLVYVSLF